MDQDAATARSNVTESPATERDWKSTVPLSVTQADEILAIRNWAETRAVAATDTSVPAPQPVAAPPAPPESPNGRAIDV